MEEYYVTESDVWAEIFSPMRKYLCYQLNLPQQKDKRKPATIFIVQYSVLLFVFLKNKMQTFFSLFLFMIL